jgi:AcrR family transcriptional regulator
MPALTPERRAKVRENIELAAIRCFVRRGFHGTTTREIAAEAGVSTGGLYAHYPGKEEFFPAIIERYRRVFAQPDNPLLIHFASTRFPDDIPALAEAIEAVIRKHRDFWLLWYVDVLEFGGKHFADSLLQDVPDHPGLRARFKELAGSDRLRVDAKTAFHTVYLHLFNHLIVEVLFRGTKPGVARRAEVQAIADISLHGVLALAASPPPEKS